MSWSDFLISHPAAGRFVEGLGEAPEAFVQKSPDDVVDTVVGNFVNSGFQSSGRQETVDSMLVLGGLTGDCATICAACVAVLTALGIDAQLGFYPKCFLIADANLVDIGGRKGNCDNGYWIFENHYWVICRGATYDLLFLGVPVDSSGWIYQTKWGIDESDRDFWLFGNDIVVYRNAEVPPEYTLDPDKATPPGVKYGDAAEEAAKKAAEEGVAGDAEESTDDGGGICVVQ